MVPSTVTVWLQVLVLPQPSVARQVRVIASGHEVPLVAVLRTMMVALAPVQESTAVGRSKLHVAPQATVLSGAQTVSSDDRHAEV